MTFSSAGCAPRDVGPALPTRSGGFPHRSRLPLLVAWLVLLALLAAPRAPAEDWPQFRGMNSAGIAVGRAPPIEFAPGENELWRVPLASGHSSPSVVGDSIFLTTFDPETREIAVVCLSRADGSTRWRALVPAKEIEKGHPSFNPASGTPASDGERVVAYFGSHGLIAFDLAGERLWDLEMPLAKSYCGNAASPIIVGDRVLLYRGNYVDHFVLAVDKRSGKTLWKTPQSERFTIDMACTATPIVSADRLIVHAARAVQAFALDTGREIWRANCSTTATSTPVIVGDEVVVATWNQTGEPALVPTLPEFKKLLETNDRNADGVLSREEFPRLMYFERSEGTDAPENGAPLRFSHVDRNEDGRVDEAEWTVEEAKSAERRATHVAHGVLAIPLDSEGTVDPAKIRHLERQAIPEVPSPVAHEGLVYLVKNGGILSCIDVASGKLVHRTRTGGRGTHYASPVIADGKLFTFAGDGRITVLRVGPEPEPLATNEIGERIFATPAIVDGVIYVRTHASLFAFARRE